MSHEGNIPLRFLTSRSLVILLIGLLLLLIMGGGIFVLHSSYQQAAANATATIPANPYTVGGTLALYDPLRDNSKGYQWDEWTDAYGGRCQFTNGAYHVSEPDTRYLITCASETSKFSNFVYEAQMQAIQGGLGGIMFRATRTNDTFKLYLFGIDDTGSYRFLVYTDGMHWKFVKNNSNPAIKQGLNQVNTLAVVARGSAITFYVNNQQVDSVNDSSYSTGQIGLFGYPYNTPIEEAFSNARVWSL